jgi:hypothetical protein
LLREKATLPLQLFSQLPGYTISTIANMKTFRLRTVVTFAALLICCTWDVKAQGQNHVEIMDARGWDFSKRLPLRCNWTLIEQKLVSPEAIHSEAVTSIIAFPSLWNERRPDGKGIGYETYALNVLIPDSIDRLALEIPQLYSSYNVWVNGELVSSAGKVGVDEASVKPKWVYQYASFSAAEDTLHIVLQLANFHHHKGGAMNPLYLGTVEKIESHFNWSVWSNIIEALILFLEGIFFLFFYRKIQKPVILYFALLCVTWSVRSIFSNLYPFVLVFPDFSWEWQVKIEYITLYLAVIWAALFFNSLFADISNRIFTYLPIAINLFFTVFTLLTPAIIYTRWVSVYLGIAILVLLYGVVLIVRALLVEREGSWFLMSTIWIGVLLFGYDIAAYNSSFSYNIVLLNIGYVMIFLLTTAALLFHIGVFKSKGQESDVLTMKDLYK